MANLKVDIDGLKPSEDGVMPVVLMQNHILSDEIIRLPYTGYFVDENGSSDMNVNGSTTPVSFSILSKPDRDIFIKNISVKISDAGASLAEFGNLVALANGLSFTYSTIETGEIVVRDNIKTNLDFIRFAFKTAPVGGGTDAFLSDISGGGADTYMPIIDLPETFGYPNYGLRIKKGTTAKLTFWVKDNLSGLDAFDIIATGTQI